MKRIENIHVVNMKTTVGSYQVHYTRKKMEKRNKRERKEREKREKNVLLNVS